MKPQKPLTWYVMSKLMQHLKSIHRTQSWDGVYHEADDSMWGRQEKFKTVSLEDPDSFSLYKIGATYHRGGYLVRMYRVDTNPEADENLPFGFEPIQFEWFP